MGEQLRERRSDKANLGAAAKHELAVECLYTALLQLMSTKPYASITVTDICRRAGVSRMAYYRNYADKSEILTRRLENLLEDSISQLEQGGQADEHTVVASFFASLQSDGLVQAIMSAGLVDQLMRIHFAYARRAYQNVLHLELTDAASEMRLYQLAGAMAGLILYLAEKGGTADPDELATMQLA